MDTLTIVLAASSFVVGVILTLIIKRGGETAKEKETNLTKSGLEVEAKLSEAEAEKKTLEDKLAESETEKKTLENKLSESETETLRRVEETKKKYESLLSEAKLQCEKLDGQLKKAIEGNIDDTLKEQIAQIDKLKKEIKNLEDEIEDKDDDISDLKKKISSKNSDLDDLQKTLEKEQSVSRKLQDEVSDLNRDLSNVKQQLDDKIAELNLKIGSLNFVQEILSAKEISTEDTQKLYKNINVFESFVKGQFMDLNSYLYTNNMLTWCNVGGRAGFENKKKYFIDSFEKWASTKRKSWLNGKTAVAFVGEFSAGKTSIVNRILSQDNPSIPRLPVSAQATTAIPTYIAGGSTVSYSFISGDDKRKAILETTFKKVSKEILDQIKGVSALIKYFVMTYKNPNLNGLSILDTPGFSSNDKEDRDRVVGGGDSGFTDVINECDALFWVFDVNAGTVNRSSIAVLKKYLSIPLFVVINKVDTKASSEVEKVENLIRKTLSDEGLKVQGYIRFSQTAPLADIMNPIKSVKKVTTRDTFVSDVQYDIENVLDILSDYVKKSKEKYDEEYRIGDEMKDEIVNYMRSVCDACETAHSIPRWVTHTFRSDKFEMTEEEGNNLKIILDEVSKKQMPTLKDKIIECMDVVAEVQQRWSDYCDRKTDLQKADDCNKQFKKVSKEIR